jgi:hypothetical protein
MGGDFELSEDSMFITEKYAEAIHEEIALLHVSVALELAKEKNSSSKQFTGEALMFLDRLARLSGYAEQRGAISELQHILQRINSDEVTSADIEHGEKQADVLASNKKQILLDARERYYEILKM